MKPDEDWTEQAPADGTLAFMSPADSDGNHVLMVVGGADPRTGQFDTWFDNQVSALASSFGTLRSHRGFQAVDSQPPLFGPLVEDAVEINADDGTQMGALLYGYAGPRNWQPIAIVMPAGYPADAPLVDVARERVKILRKMGYVLAPSQPPNNPAPAPAPPQAVDAVSNPADINTWGTWQNERAITRIAPCSADGAHIALTLMAAFDIGGEPLGEWFKHRIGPLVTGWSSSGLERFPILRNRSSALEHFPI